MEKELFRSRRIEEEIKKGISIILQNKIKDPRIRLMITVSSVKISRDLKDAKIFVTLLNDQDKDSIKRSIKALKKSSGFIRSLLSKALFLRVIPKLTFFYDNSLVEGIRLSNLVTNIVKNDGKRNLTLNKKKKDDDES